MKKYFLKIKAFVFLTILIIGSSFNGQEPKLIKTQGSRPEDNVSCSLLDKTGRLWFGTTGEGIYKYDGKSFSQFTVTNGLNSNKVYCMLEDKEGKIWIGTVAGVCVYDGKSFKNVQIHLRKNLPPNKVRNTHDVFSIMQDKSGKFWFATIDGVYVYDGRTFSSFIVDSSRSGFLSSNNNVESIVEDKAGNIWLGGRVNDGVFRYDGKYLTNLTLNEPKDFNWAKPAMQDKKGNIWFSNWSGAYRYDGKIFTKNDGIPGGPVTRIIEDRKGNLWFAGGGRGICRYDGKTYTCFTAKDGLTNTDVWSILEDKAGNVWVGTRNTGLYRFDGKSFISFSE